MSENVPAIATNSSEIDGLEQDLQDPQDTENSYLLRKDCFADGSCRPHLFERRPSYLHYGISGSGLRQSIENDRLMKFVERSVRINEVLEKRPLNLIGDIGPLFDWCIAYKDKSYLKSLKSKELVEYYKKQNDLIDKFEEVDKLLNSGIPTTMIKNYTERHYRHKSGKIIQKRLNEEIDKDVGNHSYHHHDHSSHGNHHHHHYHSNDEQHHIDPEDIRFQRADSAVPANIDLETGNVLGYNKDEEIKIIERAIHVNFFLNLFLLFGKVIVAVLTSSISIVASLIDSILDFLSTVIIFMSNKLSQEQNVDKFPVGKTRLEPIGVLIFATIIIMSFVQVGIEAAQRLFYYVTGNRDQDVVEIGLDSTIIMSVTILTKLISYFWCKTIKSSSVEALTKDALVDVIFNTFSILMPVLYWFDPLGALLLSIYIIKEWLNTLVEHVVHLTGKSADKQDEQVILYLCTRFAEKIKKVKQLYCYHVGDSINVEVDLILDNKLSFRDSHDIAEALQYTLESLPMVNIERAYVHVDYDEANYAGHLK